MTPGDAARRRADSFSQESANNGMARELGALRQELRAMRAQLDLARAENARLVGDIQRAHGELLRPGDGTAPEITATPHASDDADGGTVEWRANQRRLSIALEAAGGGYYERSLDFSSGFVSAGWARLFGYELSELPPMEELWHWFAERLHPADEPDRRLAFEEFISGRTHTYRAEFRVRHKDGQWLWIATVAQALQRDEHDRIDTIAGLGFDITERRHSEQALKDSEAFLSAILANIQDGLIVFDTDLHVLHINPIMQRWSRHSNSIPTAHGSASPGEIYQDPITAVAERVLLTGRAQCADIPGPDGSGVERLDLYCCPIIHPDTHETTGVVEVARDVSERHRAARTLAENEARFRSYVESAPVGIYVTDENGVIVDVNPATQRDTGYSFDELVGAPFTRFVHADEQLRSLDDLCGLEIAEKDRQIRLTKRDGSVGVFSIVVQRLLDCRSIAYATDITEAIGIAEQLRQGEKMRAVGQLAGGIAHDFNNQLAAIIGNAELLRAERENDPACVKYSDNILLAAKRAADLTTQILAFSRVGKLINEKVDVHDLVNEVIRLLKHTFDRKITIRKRFAAVHSCICGDPTLLQNAILNVAINARDAMPDGGILTFETDMETIDFADVGLRDAMQPGGYVVLRIADTGVGMNPETQARVFEPFFTEKPPGQGTGMGLAAVYGTAKSHGGAVTVASEVGRGSVFSLYLPFTSAPSPKPQRPTTRRQRDTGRSHILVVDDETLVRETTASMLRNLGYRISVCSNGVEAVELYREHGHTIDLVLLDIVMPEMDGEETLRQLLAIDSGVPILVTSGHNFDALAQRVVEWGVRDYVQKPCHRDKLVEKIEHAMRPR